MITCCWAGVLLRKTLELTEKEVYLEVHTDLKSSQLEAGLRSICVTETSTGLNLPSTVDSEACSVYADFREQIRSSGWNRLSVRFEDSMLSHYAAGLAEGLLMGHVISTHIHTVREVYSYSNFTLLYNHFHLHDQSLTFILRSPIPPQETQYWTYVRHLRAQLEGILDGMNLITKQTNQIEDLYLVNSDGDLDNLIMLVTPRSHSRLSLHRRNRPGRCSALVKVVGDEVYFGHTTMEDYREMNRVLKRYQVNTTTITMSSYPGALSSTDDFILTSAGLALMETSLEVAEDVQLVDSLSSVPAFMRVQAAIRYSSTPQSFISTFLTHDSYTYFSQWMILDYKPTASRPFRSFFILETAPRYAKYEDMTSHLEAQSYWSSFNWPYFPTTLSALGFPAHTSSGDYREGLFSYLQSRVYTLEDMQRTMQFNNWKKGECQVGEVMKPCKPWEAISPRFDLQVKEDWFGGTDSKVTSRALMNNQGFLAISGPTHQSQPVFSFPDSWTGYIPRTWDFTWVYFPN